LSAMVGTPKYMAPEQLDPDRAKPLTYAVDVYALGMVLYVLVAGKPPFDETSPTKITSRKQRGDLPSLRRGRPHVPADLAAICAACLEYDPARRPTDGRALAELLRAFLAGETVPVRRVGPLEQAARWVRRNPWPTALYATALAGALLVAGTTVHYNRRLVDAAGSLDKTNRSLVAALDKANTLNYASQMQRAALAWNDRADPNAALEVLETLRPTAGATAADGLPLDPTDRRGFEWHFLHAAVRGDAEQLNTSHGQALDVEYSPDDRLVATTGDDATVCLWDANDKRLMRRLVGASHKLRTVAWSGDGSRIAASGHGPGVYVWTVADGALRQSIDTDFDPVIALTFHPKEDVLLVGEQQARGAEHGVINAYRPSDGRLLFTFKPRQGDNINTVVFTPDGKTLMVAAMGLQRTSVADAEEDNEQPNVQHWSWPDFQPGLKCKHANWLTTDAAAVSGDGRLFAYVGVDEWSRAARKPRIRVGAIRERPNLELDGPSANLLGTAFSRDGELLAGVDRGGTAWLWRLGRDADGRPTSKGSAEPLRGCKGRCWSAAFSPDGKELAAAGADGIVRFHRTDGKTSDRRRAIEPQIHSWAVWGVRPRTLWIARPHEVQVVNADDETVLWSAPLPTESQVAGDPTFDLAPQVYVDHTNRVMGVVHPNGNHWNWRWDDGAEKPRFVSRNAFGFADEADRRPPCSFRRRRRNFPVRPQREQNLPVAVVRPISGSHFA
ncbi:MAG: protein kinase family protein, partial [Planctomycetia bacterium]